MKGLGLRPKDYLGQNFLVSEVVLEQILEVAEIKKSDIVVEVGPGMGVLTQVLAERAGKVIAIEKDRTFVPVLNKYFDKNKNVEIVEQDVLKYNFESLPGKYKIVANIPYYLTSHLIQILLALKNKPGRIVLMVQKEVGERIVAAPGALSLLGISVQMFADAEVVATVPKQNFWPMPKVGSCIILIQPKNKFPEIEDQKLFFRILKVAFAGKRKQIHNTLANGFKENKNKIPVWLKDAKIEPSKRPQDLAIGDWVRLYQVISSSRL